MAISNLRLTTQLGAASDEPTAHRRGLSLFWRTFFLLGLLLLGSVMAWTNTLREMEIEPRALQTASQIASVVNLSRAAVMHADAISRVSLFKTMKDQEQVTIQLREPRDTYAPFGTDSVSRRISREIEKRVGTGTLVARSVNQEEGLWIGFTIDTDGYWLKTDLARFDSAAGSTWLVWILMATALSLAGAAWIARLINRPLKELSMAASRVREGDFEATALDETVGTREIRAVNVGFNRMTKKLAKIEQDRAVMLAGISHDLRTPLARLRLETELSVADNEAREHMSSDIAQLDAIIGKFLDYARPGAIQLGPVSLNETVDICLANLRKHPDICFKVALQDGLLVMADSVELQRIICNLLENARRYGQTSDSEVAHVDVSARYQGKRVVLRIRDHGPGVPPDQLQELTTPFFRGETARTSANSTGLGLAIVEQTISRMNGAFDLTNANRGGLCATIMLRRAYETRPA